MNKKGSMFPYLFWTAVGIAIGIYIGLTLF